MKFLFIIFLLCFFIQSNTYTHDLRTPKGSAVPHSHPEDTGWYDYHFGDSTYGYYTAEAWTIDADNYYRRYFIERVD